MEYLLPQLKFIIFKNENIKIFNGVIEKIKNWIDASHFLRIKGYKVKITLVYDTEFGLFSKWRIYKIRYKN